ncbi:MAG: hypothetical protein JWL77_3821 [Chthonomonadaceae bacterium]|nr:hypothetical protein [Chthonomonadaceae bacterium]
MDKQQVLGAIYAAFPEQPIPTPEVFPEHVHPIERVRTPEFLSELAGKSWRDLTPEFCVRRRYYFQLLQPESYAYYLPALLIGSLTPYSSDRDPIHSTVFAINPAFEAINHDGEDTYLRARQAAFTEPQYRAVCDFLGLALAEGERFDRFQAAHGLRWGWNRYDTPALEAAKAYIHELCTFVYPESEDPETADLCREIRTAFAATPYPGDDVLCDSQGEEPGEIAVGFRGVPWQSAHPQLLDCCSTALGFFTEAAFRYYLPVFMLAELLSKELANVWDYYGNGDPLYHLTHRLYDESVEWKAFDMRKFTTSRMRCFHREERMAIIHYLEFQLGKGYSIYSTPEIKEALARYWRLSVTWGESATDVTSVPE